MPNYKKKRGGRAKLFAKKITKTKTRRPAPPVREEINMAPKAVRHSAPVKSDLKVVKGKKLQQRRRLRIFTSFAAIVVITCVILHLVLPIGIIENAENIFALIGTGDYPYSLDSSETMYSYSRGDYFYVLTDNKINAFANSGKNIYSESHGFENPVLKTSATRALVLEQGRTSALIYNLTGLKSTITTDKSIICGNISDSGVYAIATDSDTYASTVSVYDRSNKVIYEWYSSEDKVNNVVVSPDGKKLVVSTLNAKGGTYTSKVSVFNFKSATPEFTENFDGTVVYNLDSTQSSGFSIVTANSFEFIKWSKFAKSASYTNDYNTSLFRTGKSGIVSVYTRLNDKNDNRIALFSTKGVFKSEFNFKGPISDIQIAHGHIYLISDTNVYLLDNNGKILRSAECGFGGVRLAVLRNNSVAVITDNEIQKVELEQEEG